MTVNTCIQPTEKVVLHKITNLKYWLDDTKNHLSLCLRLKKKTYPSPLFLRNNLFKLAEIHALYLYVVFERFYNVTFVDTPGLFISYLQTMSIFYNIEKQKYAIVSNTVKLTR